MPDVVCFELLSPFPTKVADAMQASETKLRQIIEDTKQ